MCLSALVLKSGYWAGEIAQWVKPCMQPAWVQSAESRVTPISTLSTAECGSKIKQTNNKCFFFLDS